MTDVIIVKNLVELKLQLYYDEINGQTFLRNADGLRELYLSRGYTVEDWESLLERADEDYSYILITLERTPKRAVNE